MTPSLTPAIDQIDLDRLIRLSVILTADGARSWTISNIGVQGGGKANRAAQHRSEGWP